MERVTSKSMRAEKLAINSQCTLHWNLEEAVDAYAAAGFRDVEPHLNLVKDWLDDGHTVEVAREHFELRELSFVASSQLEVAPWSLAPLLRKRTRTGTLSRGSARASGKRQ